MEMRGAQSLWSAIWFCDSQRRPPESVRRGLSFQSSWTYQAMSKTLASTAFWPLEKFAEMGPLPRLTSSWKVVALVLVASALAILRYFEAESKPNLPLKPPLEKFASRVSRMRVPNLMAWLPRLMVVMFWNSRRMVWSRFCWPEFPPPEKSPVTLMVRSVESG